MTRNLFVPDRDLHFVLRYSDELHGHNTIEEHRRVLKKFGSVWMGKFGLGISAKLVEKVNEQLAAGAATYVYLSAQSKIRFRAQLRHVVGGGVNARIPCPDRQRCPTYYIRNPCSIWFLLTSVEEVARPEIERLRLYNSPGMAPAFTSMRGLVYVTHATAKSALVLRGAKSRKRKANDPHAATTFIEEDFDW